MNRRKRCRLEILGNLDELNSFLGIAKCFAASKELKRMLNVIQDDLFRVQAEIGKPEEIKWSPRLIGQDDILSLEQETLRLEKGLPPLNHFIVTGGLPVAAFLQYARTLARRVERRCVEYSKQLEIRLSVVIYLDRLGSLLFRLARLANWRRGFKDRSPAYYKELLQERR